MSVRSGQAKLTRALMDLLERWDDTESVWRDAVRGKFEEKHLAPLKPLVRMADSAMTNMVTILHQMRRDCS